MKVAHLSDIHVIALGGAVPGRLFNKRLSGYVNLRLRRAAQHRREVAARVLRSVRDGTFDHVVITGDMTYLALQREFEEVRDLLRDSLSMDPERVTVIPGNHDAYTRGAYRAGRFESYLADYLSSDLPLASDIRTFPYPIVRLRGPLAIIGLSTAVPRPPLVASGALGGAQREALRAVLSSHLVRGRTPLLLQHHPLPQPRGRAKALLEGLWDAKQEARLLAPLGRGLVLHGHLHRRIRQRIHTAAGTLHSVGSTSSSLVDESPDRMAGYNCYDFDDRGTLRAMWAQRLDLTTEQFERVEIPEGRPIHLPATR